MKTLNKNKIPLLAFALTTTLSLGMVGNVNQVIAGTDTSNLNVSASIVTKCKLSNPVTVAFGSYDPVVTNASAALDSTGSFDIKCTKSGFGNITIDAGLNSANVVSTTRAMKETGSSNYLDYELYTTSGRTTVWDETAGGTVRYPLSGGAASANNVTETVYGRIPGAQVNAITGTYADTVVVTVTY